MPAGAAPTGAAHITLDQFGLKRLDAFLPSVATTLKGTLSADAKLAWGDKLPDGGTRATVNIDGRLQFTSRQLGNANLTFGMRSTGKAKDINGKFDIRDVDIGVARAFAPQFTVLRGTIDAEGNLSGSITNPQINGQIRLSRLGLQSDTLPLDVTNGAITADIQGRRATLDGTLGINDNGRVALKGSANWQQSKDWLAEVEIDGPQLDIRQDLLIESVIDSALTIRL